MRTRLWGCGTFGLGSGLVFDELSMALGVALLGCSLVLVACDLVQDVVAALSRETRRGA